MTVSSFPQTPHDPPPRDSVWRIAIHSLGQSVDHPSVFAAVCEGGEIRGGYLMMTGLGAAIATLGLLLSSPAVVIGAMLLSPLMGPIILLGFAFWTIDWTAARRAVVSLVVGLGLALAVAVVLTWLSPLKEATPEILARTRPNLFDLLVAAFSGVAGGYAVIRQKGETVIGVAIATALMPPIATVGFGLGTGNWSIAMGALLLFATNLIAIALAAAGMAALYGFRQHFKNRSWLGHGLVIVILGALCFPLTISLETIALESRATAASRAVIREIFGPKARLSSLSVRSVASGLQLDGLVATPKYVDDAAAQIRSRLQSAFGKTSIVNVDQVVLADPARAATSAASGPETDPIAARTSALREMVPFPSATVAYDPKQDKGVVILRPQDGLDIKSAHALELGLRARKDYSKTEVVPALAALPKMVVQTSNGGSAPFDVNLPIALWALERWGVEAVDARLCGPGLNRADVQALQRALQGAFPSGIIRPIVSGGPRCERPTDGHTYLMLAPA